jgi:hypothetical protein
VLKLQHRRSLIRFGVSGYLSQSDSSGRHPDARKVQRSESLAVNPTPLLEFCPQSQDAVSPSVDGLPSSEQQSPRSSHQSKVKAPLESRRVPCARNPAEHIPRWQATSQVEKRLQKPSSCRCPRPDIRRPIGTAEHCLDRNEHATYERMKSVNRRTWIFEFLKGCE